MGFWGFGVLGFRVWGFGVLGFRGLGFRGLGFRVKSAAEHLYGRAASSPPRTASCYFFGPTEAANAGEH